MKFIAVWLEDSHQPVKYPGNAEALRLHGSRNMEEDSVLSGSWFVTDEIWKKFADFKALCCFVCYVIVQSLHQRLY